MSGTNEPSIELDQVRDFLLEAVEESRSNHEGHHADYIPELAHVDLEQTSAAVTMIDGSCIHSQGAENHWFTLQSSAKLLVFAGLLEEQGPDRVFETVGSEPSGESFGSLARLDSKGPMPANPLINSGAIALCSLLNGPMEDRLGWIETWAEKLYGKRMHINYRVMSSERRTGDRNRAIAYLLQSNRVLKSSVEETLEAYFALCALESRVLEASHLACVLASGGLNPQGKRVLSEETAATVISLMTTCGMYDESGTYLRLTGMPAKSGVSGVIIAVALGVAGVAVASPRVNQRGGSVRGHLILRHISSSLGWHFARLRCTK